MSDTFDTKKHGAIIAIPFFKANLTTGASTEDLARGGAGVTFIAPRSGSVIGISASCAAITAGTITLTPTSAGTEIATTGVPQPALTSDNDTNGTYVNVRPGAITFAAGAQLGISATTTTTLNPTNTLDADATLFIQLNP
jgi:hypothetical protein